MDQERQQRSTGWCRVGKYHVHRTDANAEELYDAARGLGMSVVKLGRPVDAALGAHGVTVLAEVKTKAGKLRPDQSDFLRDFQGWATVLRSVEDVIALHREMVAVADAVADVPPLWFRRR